MRRAGCYTKHDYGIGVCSVVIIFALSSCGGGGGSGEEGVVSVNPNAPDQVSSVLFIPDSTTEPGAAPAESQSVNRPTLSLEDDTATTNLPAIAGGTPTIDLRLDSQAGYQQCYVQVSGASTYFVIDSAQGQGSQSGALSIPLGFNTNADFTSGSFCVYVSIRDQNGLVSNPVERCFNALPARAVQDFAFCANDYPEEACAILLGEDPGFNSEFDPGVNIPIFEGSFVANQSCENVAPNVTIFNQDYRCGESGLSGECGACITRTSGSTVQ